MDHVFPRRWFSDPIIADHEDNLLSRCASCHGRKTAGAERKLLQGDVLAFRRYGATVEFLPCATEWVNLFQPIHVTNAPRSESPAILKSKDCETGENPQDP